MGNENETKAMELMQTINKNVTGLNGTVVDLGKKVDGFDQRVITLEEASRKRVVSLPGVNEGKDKFSFQRAVLAIASKDWKDAGFEKEVFDQSQKKALSQGTASAGGYIVPEQYIAELVELLRAQTVVREIGATVLSGLTGSPVPIPKQTGGATGYWVAENSPITDSDQTFSELSLTPKQASAMTKMANRLLKMSNPSAEALVRDDIAKTLARLIDLAALRGSGTANQPTGIANTVGINTVSLATHGAVPSIDKLFEMIYKVELANAAGNKMGWIIHPRTWNSLRTLKDSENRYYLVPDVANLERGTLLGYPCRKTTQIPINLAKGSSGNVCSEIYFGNWSELIIGEWGGMEILASMETSDAFEKNQTWVRVIQEVDIALRHPLSFCLVSDALA